MSQRILVFTPTWMVGGQEAMREECRISVEMQRIDGERLWFIGIDNPYPIGDLRNVLYQYQRARGAVLEHDFDALITFEHDMALPEGAPGADRAFQRMIDTEADVVYGVYILRHGLRVLNTWRYENNRELGMSLTNYPRDLKRAAASGEWRVSGIGFGCTLIRRHVLEQIAFRDGGDGRQWCPDLPFAEDALRAGYISKANFTVLATHYESESGRWIHPYGSAGSSFGEADLEMDRYTVVESVNVVVEGQLKRLTAGQTIGLLPDDAHDLVRAGYVIAEDRTPAAAVESAPVEDTMVTPPETTEAPANKRRKRQ